MCQGGDVPGRGCAREGMYQGGDVPGRGCAREGMGEGGIEEIVSKRDWRGDKKMSLLLLITRKDFRFGGQLINGSSFKCFEKNITSLKNA